MRNIFAFGCACVGAALASTADAQEILVNRYDVLVQHDKVDIVQKTTKELTTKEGQAVVAAACAFFGCDPDKVNASIAEAAKLIVPNDKQDMRGIIRTDVGYTICEAKLIGPRGAGDKDVETHGGSTFNTTIYRVVPGASNDDGLGWYMSVPFKVGTDTRVNAVFDVYWVKADAGWQTKYPQCRKTFEHPWASTNNETRLNVPCELDASICNSVK